MIGNFPPPLNGANLCTQRLAEILGSDVYQISLSTGTKKRGLLTTTVRFLNIAAQLCRYLLRSRGFNCVYFQMYAGKAILTLLPFILLSRLFGKKIFLHTNSQMHYRKKHRLTDIAIRMAGRECCLVAQHLSQMELGLLHYPLKYNAVVSNIAFVDIEGANKYKIIDKESIKIGMLSNLTEDKGILRLAEVAITLKEIYGVNVEVDVAGPFDSATLEQNFVGSLSKCGITPTVRGLLDRREISQYLDGIDCFVMLTDYSVEAEPLVLYEAALRGVRIVAGNVGVVEGQLNKIGDGFCVDPYDIDGACKRVLEMAECKPQTDVIKNLELFRKMSIQNIPRIFSGEIFENRVS